MQQVSKILVGLTTLFGVGGVFYEPLRSVVLAATTAHPKLALAGLAAAFVAGLFAPQPHK